MSAQIFPIVGAAVTLPNPLPTQDVSDGTPDSPVPGSAIQVAGSDGTDLRVLLTSNTGQLHEIVDSGTLTAVTAITNPVTVVGDAASGAAVAGNPVLVAGSDGTDARTLSTDTSGKLNVLDQHVNSDTTIPGDAQTIVTATTTNGATQSNTAARGAIIFVTTGTVSGTLPTLQLQIQWSPDGGSTWYSIGSTTTTFALVTGNTIAYLVYPVASLSTTTGATQTDDAAFPLPKTWRVSYITTGTGISIAIASVAVNYLE